MACLLGSFKTPALKVNVVRRLGKGVIYLKIIFSKHCCALWNVLKLIWTAVSYFVTNFVSIFDIKFFHVCRPKLDVSMCVLKLMMLSVDLLLPFCLQVTPLVHF